MKAIGIFCTALLAAALSSCTVKEDRGPCPCVLDIFLEDWDLERAVFLWQEDPTKISRPQSIQLAQLAEGSQPITAIKIYQELLETQLQSLVEAKISSASAAGEAIQKEIEMLVSRLKTLITRVYGAEAWTEYLASLRNRDLRI